MLVTSEYRYGTIRPTILFTPHRSRVLAAKAIAGALAGLAFGVVGEALGWALGYAILSGRGITFALSGGDSRATGARRRSPASRCGARSASGSARSSATRSAR